MYEGKYTERDPGLSSNNLLAVFNTKHQAELRNDNLISSAKQIKSNTAVANDANLEHLQVIRLHEQIQGAPDQPFYLEGASTVRNMDKLEGRETFRSIGDSVQRKDRLEESKIKKTTFAEIKYDVTKLTGKTFVPIEDKMRTIQDPEAIDLQNLTWEFSYARNQEIKNVITEGITKGVTGAAVTNLGSISAAVTTYHSPNNVGNALSSAIKTFRTRNRVPIDTAIFTPEGFDLFTSNTWVGTKAGPNNVEPQHFPNGGVTTLPGFGGITAIIEPELTGQNIWFLNKANALRTAQGPTLYRRYYSDELEAESVKIIDFVQFLSVDKELDHSKIGNRYFAFKASYG